MDFQNLQDELIEKKLNLTEYLKKSKNFIIIISFKIFIIENLIPYTI